MPRLGRGTPQRGAHLLPAPPTTRNPGALTQWAAALGALNSSPAKWLAIGDGVTEGQGAATRAARWIDAALATIRTSKSLTGGQGFVSAAYQVTGPDSPWAGTQVTASGVTSTGTTAGVGYRFRTLSPSGSTGGAFGTSAFGTAIFGGSTGGGTAGSVVFTVTGNSVDLWYLSEAASGQLSYRVDSGTTTTIDTAASHDLRVVSGIPLGATGSHTVTVAAASGTVYVTGLMVYSADAGSGVQLYDAARVGATTATYAGNPADFVDFATSVAPDLVTIELGYDDAASGISPATSGSNLSTIVATLRALPKAPSIVLVVGYHPSGASAVTSWPDYAAVQRRMAVVDTNLGLVDLTVPLPAADLSGSGLYRADGRYPNDTGHAAVAAQVANFVNLTVPVAPTVASGRFLLLAGAA